MDKVSFKNFFVYIECIQLPLEAGKKLAVPTPSLYRDRAKTDRKMSLKGQRPNIWLVFVLLRSFYGTF